jgi:hypothetical protein
MDCRDQKFTENLLCAESHTGNQAIYFNSKHKEKKNCISNWRQINYRENMEALTW